MNQKRTKLFQAITFRNKIHVCNWLIITRSILGITLAIISSAFTTPTKETTATTELPVATKKAEKRGYMIANYTIHDQVTFKKYMEAAGPLAPKFKGKVIIYDVKSRTLEGNPKEIMAVAEFPSVADVERFYNSPEYTAARKFRIASTEGSVMLAQGLFDPATEGTSQLKGYMIANYTIKDQKTFKKYMEAAGSLASKFKGKVIIYDVNARTLEGNPEKVMAVAEFPSVAETERFYNSPEYTAARKFRIASTEGSVVLAKGLPELKQKNEQTNSQSRTIMNKEETEKYISVTVDLFTKSTRTPILRTPDEYGMDYEDIFFQAMDGVTLEGWFIPGKSDRLLIINHPMPANRYGYPGHLEPWKNFGGFEVNFLPEYKVLHDAGYNILAYDMRNHGRSGIGSGGLLGHGLFEYRDVIGSLRYAKSRPDTKDMKVALYSRCLGANSTIVAMKKHPEEFKDVMAMIALQPVTPKVFLERAMDMAGIENGIEMFATAYYNRTGLHLDQVWPMEYSKAVTIPTLVAQVHDDFLTKPSNVQEIYDNISAKDKKLFWIEGTDQRFEGYNYFGKHPQLVLEWFDSHMK